MKEESSGRGKIYNFFDWLWRLIVLNTLTLLTSIAIVTIVPAFIACFKTIKESDENKWNSKIIVPYYKNFAIIFKETVWLGIAILTMLGVAIFSLVMYYNSIFISFEGVTKGDLVWSIVSIIMFIILVTLVLIFLMGFLQLPIVVSYAHLRIKDLIKTCFFMAFKLVGATMLELGVIVISIVIMLSLKLLPIWVMFGISCPLFVSHMLSRRAYTYFFDKEDIDDIAHIDIQGTTEVRETYEDDKKAHKK